MKFEGPGPVAAGNVAKARFSRPSTPEWYGSTPTADSTNGPLWGNESKRLRERKTAFDSVPTYTRRWDVSTERGLHAEWKLCKRRVERLARAWAEGSRWPIPCGAGGSDLKTSVDHCMYA